MLASGFGGVNFRSKSDRYALHLELQLIHAAYKRNSQYSIMNTFACKYSSNSGASNGVIHGNFGYAVTAPPRLC